METGSLPIGEDELLARNYAEIEMTSPLTLVDLREAHAVRMGVPTDVYRASNHTLARQWSAAFYAHPAAPDAIVYPSRLNGQTNIAVYDRVVSKLRVHGVRALIAAPGLAAVLNHLDVAIAQS